MWPRSASTADPAPRDPPWPGIGLGLAGQGALSLSLDFFAALRARDYTKSLDRFEIGASAAPLSVQPTAPWRSASFSFGEHF